MKHPSLPHPFSGNWRDVPHAVLAEIWKELSEDRDIIGLFWRMKAGSPLDISLSSEAINIAAQYHPIKALGEYIFIVDIEIRPKPSRYKLLSFPVLITPTTLHPMLGDTAIMESLQKDANFEDCSDEDIIAYFKFFTSMIVDGKSRFLPVETLEEVGAWIELSNVHEHAALKLSAGLHKLECVKRHDGWEITVPILYDFAIFKAVFEVNKLGKVNMTCDTLIVGDDEANIIYKTSPTLVRHPIVSQGER